MPGHPRQLLERLRTGAPAVGVPAGVELDRGHAERRRGLDRGGFRIDEERDPDPRRGEPRDGLGEPRVVPGQIEPALGGHFLAALRHQGGLVRPEPADHRDDVGRQRQLRVEHRPHRGRQGLQVPVVDVPAVLAQMRGDAVGPGRLAKWDRGGGVRLIGPAGLPDGGDVIDVDVQPHGDSLLRRRAPGKFRTIARSC